MPISPVDPRWKVGVDPTEGMTRSTVFKTPYDVERYMGYGGPGRSEGWREGPKESDSYSHIKRFGGVWFQVDIPKSHWDTRLHVHPTTFPRGPNAPKTTDDEAWKAAYKRISAHIEVEGLTMEALDHKIVELAKAWKEIAGGRPRKDTSDWGYHSREIKNEFGGSQHLKGAEAVAQWKKEVEKILQDEIDSAGKGGHDWDTGGLVGNILENYGRVLEGPSRATLAGYIRTILEGLARRGKIDKLDFGRGDIRWRSMNFVEKSRYAAAVRQALRR